MDPLIPLVLRIVLAPLFLVAAWHKLGDLRAFAATLADYRLLPAWATWPGAAAVVAGELGVAAALVAGRPAGFAGAALLLLVYAGAVAINLARGRRHIDCGCTGPAARRPVSGWLVGRNALVAGVALVGLAPVTPRGLVWLDGFTAVAAAATLAACWMAADRLLGPTPALVRDAT